MIALALVLVVTHGLASGQCLNWSSEFGTIQVTRVTAMRTFDDGSGPALFAANYGPVRKWNGIAWSDAGHLYDMYGEPNLPEAFEVFDPGSGPALYAGGYFRSIDNFVLSKGVARWNGTIWTPVGTGVQMLDGSHGVYALCAHNDGSGPALFVGGRFPGAWNGTTHILSEGILKWNGSAWAAVGSGISGGSSTSGPSVMGLLSHDDGTGPALYACGDFTAAGGVPANGIARWNGTSWSAVGAGVNWGFSMASYDDGGGPRLYLTRYSPVSGSETLLRWDGSSWTGVPGSSMLDSPRALRVFHDGSSPKLYVGGWRSGSVEPVVAAWDGASWTELGTGPHHPSLMSTIYSLEVFDDGLGGGPDLFVGGAFSFVGDGLRSYCIAKWHGCQTPIAAICPGDRTLAPCPCHNSGSSGRGCENSAGTGGAQLSATGTTTPDTLALTSSGELATALSFFLQGDALATQVTPFGDGLRCIGGQIRRMYVHSAVNGVASAPQPGDPSISQRAASLGDPLFAGSVRYYQVWYRDGAASFCAPPNGGSSNLSNGLRVIW